MVSVHEVDSANASCETTQIRKRGELINTCKYEKGFADKQYHKTQTVDITDPCYNSFHLFIFLLLFVPHVDEI